MSIELRRFSKIEIYISKHEAWSILQLFWPGNGIPETSLTDEDINFAQGLLLEAIDASYKMGYVHIVYDQFYGKIPGSFTDLASIIRSFAKKAARHWFRHLGRKTLNSAEIYAAVRQQIALNFKTVMELRKQSGELVY
ncbi:hypothetical protein ACQR1W_17415 [Bradyrhizobium sp. HKCCYLS1011]|uniref:hypothetical protein n=1 Tax=Bradyrhizobium sp. HKCCYLS1011 TaxID=3420733 RepID=UPI003EB7E0FD